jgi:hypothetical protein
MLLAFVASAVAGEWWEEKPEQDGPLGKCTRFSMTSGGQVYSSTKIWGEDLKNKNVMARTIRASDLETLG